MDGRTKRTITLSAIALSLATAVGCKTTSSKPVDPTPYEAPVTQQPSTMSKFFGTNSNFTPQAPAEVPVVRDTSRHGKGLGAEGEIGLATARFDAAAMKTSTVERDQMLDSARQGYERALKVDPKNKEAYIGLARLYSHTGNKENAIATLRTATEIYPQDHELWHRFAALNIQFKEPAAALQATQQCLRLDPNNITYQKTLALCQGHMNDWQAAFNTLVGNNLMSEPEARYFLGRALIDVGRMDEGKAQIESAANMNSGFTLPRQFLADLANGGPKTKEPLFLAGYDANDPPLPK